MQLGNILQMRVKDWENYFSNRSNTREISYHGGGTYFGYFKEGIWDQQFSEEEMLAVYPHMVQAALNKWSEWSAIERDPFESCPIHDIAGMAFGRGCVFHKHLHPFYERLWRESPRPHDHIHRWLALNSQGEIPVSRAELGLLFEMEGWNYIAFRVAVHKGWLNDACTMLEELDQSKLPICDIADVVRAGLPRQTGIRLLEVFHSDSKYAQELIVRWQED